MANTGTPSLLSSTFNAAIKIDKYTTFTQDSKYNTNAKITLNKDRYSDAKYSGSAKFIYHNPVTGKDEVRDLKDRAKDLKENILETNTHKLLDDRRFTPFIGG